MNASTLEILQVLRSIWNKHDDGPIVTMDAGANVHAFFREDQEPLVKQAATALAKFKIFDNTNTVVPTK